MSPGALPREDGQGYRHSCNLSPACVTSPGKPLATMRIPADNDLMNLPPEIELVEMTEGVAYRLPDRSLGKLRFLGLIPLGVGLAMAFGALTWAATVISHLFADFPGWAALIPALFALPFLVGAVSFAAIGLFVLCGHSEVEVRLGGLFAVEKAGPIVWRRRRPTAAVRRFLVDRGQTTVNGQAVTEGFLATWPPSGWSATERSPCCSPPATRLAMLRGLAEELAKQCQVQVESAGESAPPTSSRSSKRTRPGC